jgi:hypothetical protein
MIQHIVQKKRVIVRDCDITIGEDVWRKIMRHVLGRHFSDLRGKGPGWSFSYTHLETFSAMVGKHLALLSDQKETTSSCSEDEKSTQTSVEEEEQLSFDEKSVEPQTTQILSSSTDDETTIDTTLEDEQQCSSCDEKSFQNSETQTDEEDVNNNSFHIGSNEESNLQSFQNSETQTCSKILFETKQNGNHVYKFDVDDHIRFFVDRWTQKVNFLV